ncbi:IS3 family transposase [uncultured Haemophilus sp.]
MQLTFQTTSREFLFRTLRKSCFHRKSFTGIDELEKVINDYVQYY